VRLSTLPRLLSKDFTTSLTASLYVAERGDKSPLRGTYTTLYPLQTGNKFVESVIRNFISKQMDNIM
jgi:hypothetical protein